MKTLATLAVTWGLREDSCNSETVPSCFTDRIILAPIGGVPGPMTCNSWKTNSTILEKKGRWSACVKNDQHPLGQGMGYIPNSSLFYGTAMFFVFKNIGPFWADKPDKPHSTTMYHLMGYPFLAKFCYQIMILYTMSGDDYLIIYIFIYVLKLKPLITLVHFYRFFFNASCRSCLS